MHAQIGTVTTAYSIVPYVKFELGAMMNVGLIGPRDFVT